MLYKYMVLKNNLCIIENHVLLLDCISVTLEELTIKGYTYVLIIFLKAKVYSHYRSNTSKNIIQP